MKQAIPELLSAASFEPADLAVMQSVLDDACRRRSCDHPEKRAALATVIFNVYAQGERDRQKLLDAAMAVVM